MLSQVSMSLHLLSLHEMTVHHCRLTWHGLGICHPSLTVWVLGFVWILRLRYELVLMSSGCPLVPTVTAHVPLPPVSPRRLLVQSGHPPRGRDQTSFYGKIYVT